MKLSVNQIAIREKWIAEFAETGNGTECPCCNRSFVFGKDRAEKMATENNRALNALVAALYPVDQDENHEI